MMTSRERVRRTVEFDSPDRVPRDLWALPFASLQHGEAAMKAFQDRWPVDFAAASVPNPALQALRCGDWYALGTYRDEWGCEFENIQAGLIGEVKRPFLDDWSRMDSLRPPVEALQVDLDAVARLCAASDKWVLADSWARPFERAQFLRGSENLYLDLAEENSEVLHLLDVIHQFNLKELEVWARTPVDALAIMDDWGSQRALLISPDQWRRLFKPMYQEYADIAHHHGKKIFMHSDGYLFDVYADLIEIGVAAINSQLFVMDIEEIGRRYRGQITFWGEMDRQHLLPHGTPQEAYRDVQRVLDALYLPEGGVIAEFEMTAGARLEVGEAIFRAWDELPAQTPVHGR